MPTRPTPATRAPLPPNLDRALTSLRAAIDREEWPRSAAYEVVLALLDAYNIDGVVGDPDDDDFVSQGLQFIRTGTRMIADERAAWDRIVPADPDADVPI